MLTDESLMPWGKYKGHKMSDVPDDYLLCLHNNKKCSGVVLEYIEDNLDAIKFNLKQSKNSRLGFGYKSNVLRILLFRLEFKM